MNKTIDTEVGGNSLADNAGRDIENRVASLEREVADLKQMLESFRRQFE